MSARTAAGRQRGKGGEGRGGEGRGGEGQICKISKGSKHKCPHIKVAELNTLADGEGIIGIHSAVC